ncbi:Nif3-like dinuclear metal center hexameric protein [Mucilaginibacter gossypii]|uniref:Nif3-like dinuclear metal center hexameric protein n=1 Tax=Mucilaginibacter gossypii TaxID=551996 RepID=UPI000DCF5AD4|nr:MULTISPECIES: Nif3-like dinuclear metal center hexameric protein [Mucilaginibacter]QTE39951.1 Nif3-like dinuclear metal center hexameric protein [Mucilaginibacter gossypii]RAV54291.1 NGG1p interacting factor NIF3 [Mucilaginibacter rubeus]
MNSNLSPINHNSDRRKFITQLSALAGTAALLSTPFTVDAITFTNPDEHITVGQIIDLFMKQVPGAPFPNTVDTLKSGNRDIVVTGIVTTMFATIGIIEKAISLGANFIIAHEPTFYNHADETTWLANDDVFQYKKQLLDKHNIAVWRNHDTIHSLKPDGVGIGLLKQLDWVSYYKPETGNLLSIPSTSLSSLIETLKKKLKIEKVRYIGNPSQSCQKVLLLPGAAGGKRQITEMSTKKPDVLICGEISEWETAEYVRDAQAKGDKLSLIVLGHIASEEPGSEFMIGWLKQNVPGIKATHIHPGNSLAFL